MKGMTLQSVTLRFLLVFHFPLRMISPSQRHYQNTVPPPQDVHILISQSHEYVSVQDREKLRVQMELRLLIRGP